MTKRKRPSRATWLAIKLPSNSLMNYEDAGDREAEHHVEYVTGNDYKYSAGDMQFEGNHHELLRLSSEKINDILFDCTDHSATVAKMHEYHTEAFDHCASEDLGLELGLKHDRGDTALIRLGVATQLLRRMKRDKFEAFTAIFDDEDRHWPKREATRLLAKPLREWGDTELGWLLRAALEIGKEVPLRLTQFERNVRQASGLPITHWVRQNTEHDFDSMVFERVYSNEGEYNAWSDAVDWKKYETKIEEARAELFADLSEEDQQMLIDKELWRGERSWHARCLLTLEMDLVGGGMNGVR